MKRTFTLLTLLSLLIPATSQKIHYIEHCYIPSDSIIKQQVMYVDPGIAGKNVEWDFSKLETLTDNYILTYSGDIDSLCGREHKTRYYYKQTESGIWCTGFENANSYIHYTDSILEFPFPIQYGDEVTVNFKGDGEHGYKLPLSVEGSVTISVDATGTLLLPEAQTEAIRIKQVTNYTEAGIDNSAITKTTYRWYANGYRYPVFESICTTYKTESGKDSTAFSSSFLYSSSITEQRMREIENESKWFSKEQFEFLNETANVDITDLEIYPNPVQHSATLSCNVSQNTAVEIRIYSGSGALVYETKHNANAGLNTWSIPTVQLNVGSYFVYVVAVNRGEPVSTVLIRI